MSRANKLAFVFLTSCVYRFEFTAVCQPLFIGEENTLTFCVDADPDRTDDVPTSVLQEVLAPDGSTVQASVFVDADGCTDAAAARLVFTPVIPGTYRVILKSSGPRPADYGVSRFSLSELGCGKMDP